MHIRLRSKLFLPFSFVHDVMLAFACLQAGMTKTDAAVQTLTEINPDVILEVGDSSFVKSLRLILFTLSDCI